MKYETDEWLTVAVLMFGAVLLVLAISLPVAWYHSNKMRYVTEHGYVQRQGKGMAGTSFYWTKADDKPEASK